ncbi:MAG: hypothetical protein WCJ41_09700 [Aestuariivirga sp.]|uniref:hypothetical protein n=1 Tax=Aestuariivirga sp. TaxID=2650926 RepID=UPI003016AB82
MEKKLKTFRVAALLSAVNGVSILLISGATPAKAAEERLHNSSYVVYGLVPLSESSKDSGKRAGNTTSVKSAFVSVGTSKRGPKGASSNEPKIEDPPLPTYDGPSTGGNTMASNEGGSQVSSN